MKDTLAGAGEKKDIPVVLGHGRLDLRSVMAALLEIRYPYQVGLEDEVSSDDPLPGIAQSFGYMRGTANHAWRDIRGGAVGRAVVGVTRCIENVAVKRQVQHQPVGLVLERRRRSTVTGTGVELADGPPGPLTTTL